MANQRKAQSIIAYTWNSQERCLGVNSHQQPWWKILPLSGKFLGLGNEGHELDIGPPPWVRGLILPCILGLEDPGSTTSRVLAWGQ